MRHLTQNIILLFMVALITFCISDDESHARILQPNDIVFSPKMKRTKIAVVTFLPLPYTFAGTKRPHERVFTDEIYAENPEGAQVTGDFIPADYLGIINKNIQSLASFYGIPIEIVGNSLHDRSLGGGLDGLAFMCW